MKERTSLCLKVLIGAAALLCIIHSSTFMPSHRFFLGRIHLKAKLIQLVPLVKKTNVVLVILHRWIIQSITTIVLYIVLVILKGVDSVTVRAVITQTLPNEI